MACRIGFHPELLPTQADGLHRRRLRDLFVAKLDHSVKNALRSESSLLCMSGQAEVERR